jgi:hypothetical protein
VAVGLATVIICALVGLSAASGVALLLGVLASLAGSGLLWYGIHTRRRTR